MLPITPAQAVRNAIAAEAAAARFYEALASRTQEPDVRAFFESMVRVEREHGAEIEKIGRPAVGCPLPAFAGQGVELVETAPEWKAADHLGLDEALHLALSCENQAACYYGALAVSFGEPAASFFEDVARSETEHARMIESVLRQRIASGVSSFTLGQVVRNMIEAERASARFYKTMALRANHLKVRAFFLGMVDVEELHAGQIESMSQSIDSDPVAEHANIPVDTVETPPSWTPSFDVDLRGALAIALDCERRAGRFYRMVAGYLLDDHAAFVREMADTEDDHARSIEHLLEELADERHSMEPSG